MYRLGQSSLPTEGTGPVVNLFTREVNDVRDGLFADLDRLGTGCRVLAAGLLLSRCACRRSSRSSWSRSASWSG